jgi:ABC-type uncharacterized transport system substrate-binding protein
MRFKRQLACWLIAAGLLLSGCATAPPPAEPAPVEPTPQASDPDLRPVTKRPAEPKPEPVAAEPPAVAIVLTNRSAAYEDVAVALGELYGDIAIYDLSDKSQPPESAFKLINDADTDAVVAIGLKAATASIVFATAPVVFSQVFNYQDFELLTPASRGVSAIAPLDAQLAAWKDLQPTLSRVGMVIGPGHDMLIEEAEVAADRHGVTLDVSVARSDQEALFNFKRMVQDIDGFWLLPDNRVLSARVLREMMSQANRRNVSVLVPSRSMLSLGATVSVSTVAADIARRIRDVVDGIDDGRLEDLPPMTPLTEVLVETNDERLTKVTAADQSAEN